MSRTPWIGAVSKSGGRRLAVAIVVGALLLTGCAGSSPTEPSSSGTETASSSADAAVDFAGQTIRLVIPYGEGGTFDAMARMVADQLSEYLPGRPTVFVESVTGGGGMLGISEMSNATELTLGHFSSAFALSQILGINPTAALEELRVIGSAGGTTRMLVAATDVDLDGLRDAGAAVRFGGQGIGTGLDDAVLLAKEVAGLAGIELVSGYDGQNEIYLAMQQGEVQGGPGSVQDAAESGNPALRDMFNAGAAHFILKIGGSEDVEGVPSLADLIQDEADRSLVEAFDGMYTNNRIFVASPGTDDATLEALRQAFAQAMSDPDLVAAAEERGFVLEPVIGDEAERAFRQMLELDSSSVERLRAILPTDG